MRMDKAADYIRRTHRLIDELRVETEDRVLLAVQKLDTISARRISRELNLNQTVVEDILDQYVEALR